MWKARSASAHPTRSTWTGTVTAGAANEADRDDRLVEHVEGQHGLAGVGVQLASQPRAAADLGAVSAPVRAREPGRLGAAGIARGWDPRLPLPAEPVPGQVAVWASCRSVSATRVVAPRPSKMRLARPRAWRAVAPDPASPSRVMQRPAPRRAWPCSSTTPNS